MEKYLTYKGAVMTWECDSNRHMNVMYYVNRFEHAGRNLDLELQMFESVDKENIGLVVIEQVINYIQEVFEDDLLYVQSSLVDVGNKSFTAFHEMYNSRTDQLVSTMRVVLVLFDKVNRKGIPIPEEHKVFLKNKIFKK